MIILRHNLGHLGVNLCKQIPLFPSPQPPILQSNQTLSSGGNNNKKKTGIFQPNGTNLRRVCIFQSSHWHLTFWNKDDSEPILIKLLSLQWKSLFFPYKLYSFIFPPFPLRKILGSILTQRSDYSCLYKCSSYFIHFKANTQSS